MYAFPSWHPAARYFSAWLNFTQHIRLSWGNTWTVSISSSFPTVSLNVIDKSSCLTIDVDACGKGEGRFWGSVTMGSEGWVVVLETDWKGWVGVMVEWSFSMRVIANSLVNNSERWVRPTSEVVGLLRNLNWKKGLENKEAVFENFEATTWGSWFPLLHRSQMKLVRTSWSSFACFSTCQGNN